MADERPPRGGYPTGNRGAATRERLLESALELFSRRWYETVSVAEICRHSGLSNGVFYRHFRGKEPIFKQLSERFLESFRRDLAEVSGPTVSDRLSRFLEIVMGAGSRYRRSITVFREGQYRFPEYEQKLRAVYLEALGRIYGREVSESEYLYVTSGMRFVTIRLLYDPQGAAPPNPAQKQAVRRMIEEGVFRLPVRDPTRIFVRSPRKPEERERDRTRDRLIEAGIALFGDQGFYNVNVYEVAREAGFSVGTFYLHFPSKESFLSEIVALIGRRTRRFITINLDPGLNRLETELQGMQLFLSHFARNRNYYEIVREAEFVVKEAARQYYDRFEQGYLQGLRDTREADPRTVANALLGLSHYLGIETFFSRTIQDPEAVILDLGRFLSRGLPS
jgi:AcrR family transcriptional regulator